jgi:hypothetical protein
VRTPNDVRHEKCRGPLFIQNSGKNRCVSSDVCTIHTSLPGFSPLLLPKSFYPGRSQAGIFPSAFSSTPNWTALRGDSDVGATSRHSEFSSGCAESCFHFTAVTCGQEPSSPFGTFSHAKWRGRRRPIQALHFVTIAFSRLRLRKWEKVPDRADEGSWPRAMNLPSWVTLRRSFLGPRQALAFIRIKHGFAQADGLWRDFHQLIFADIGERFFQRHLDRRCQNLRFFCAL